VGYYRGAAWALGLEGAALLRAHAGDYDGDFMEARLDEIRHIVAAMDEGSLAEQWAVGSIDTRAGYAAWSVTYDDEDNPLFGVEEPAVLGMLDRLEPGRALDACCGTGRLSAPLVERGHSVVGVDSCPAMLARAAARVPAARLALGSLDRLPFETAAFDLAVCALALTHQPALAPALAELARVVRPGGHVLTSDIHVVSLYLGGVTGVVHDGEAKAMPATRLLASDYLSAARAAGLEVVDCAEPSWPGSAASHGLIADQWCPQAARAVYSGAPAAVVWMFRRLRRWHAVRP
jgi:ubiquinone/menaquinone biosynthesis C-methylase UbiE